MKIIETPNQSGNLRSSTDFPAEQYRVIADFTFDWETWIDPHGKWLYCSPSCERITGYPPAEFIQSPTFLLTLVHPEDHAFVAAHLTEETQCQTESMLVFRLRARNGEERWIEHLCQPVSNANGIYLGRRGSNRDITQTRLAEWAARKQEQLLEESQKIAHLGSYAIDLETNTVHWSKETFRILGLDERGAAPSVDRYASFIHPEDVQAVYDLFGLCLQTGQDFDLDYRIIRPTGEIRYVHSLGNPVKNETGRITGMMGTYQDITEKKLMAEHLRENEARYQRLATHAPDIIFRYELLPEMHLAYINPAVQTITGYRPEECYADPLLMLHMVHPDDASQMAAMVETLTLPNAPMIMRWIGKDQEIRWMESRMVPVCDAAGQLVAIEGITRDITQQKQLADSAARNAHVLRLFVENAPASIAMFDRDMRYLAYSHRYLHDYQLREQDILGRSHYDIFPEISEQWKAIHRRCLAGAVEKCDEDPFPRADGTLNWVKWEIRPWTEANGEIGGILLFSEVITDRKLAEDQLRKSEARYRSLVEQASDGIFLLDQDQNFLEANASGCAMLGYIREEILRLNLRDLIFPNNPVHAAQDDSQRLPGGTIRSECWIRCKNNTLIPVEISEKTLDNGDRHIIIRNITEHRAAEQLKAQNENRLRILQEIFHYNPKNFQDLLDFALDAAIQLTNSKIGYIYRYRETTQEFSLSTWSREVMQTCAVLEPQTLYQLEKTGLWGEAVRQRQPVIDNQFAGPGSFKKGYPAGHVAISRFLTIPVFVKDEIVAVVGVANKETDYNQIDVLQLSLLMDSVWKILERKQAEVVHHQLEEKFTKAFHTSPDSININRLSDGLYMDVNEGFCSLTGYTPQEVMGKTSAEINIWDNPQDRARLVQSLMEHGEAKNLEAPFRIKNGTVKICLMSAKVIETDGEACILSVTRDITERKQAEELLRNTTHELSHAYDATLQGWSNALELRERETAGHSQRVVALTLRLARAFGISSEDMVHIQRGALLHDIGKMGVPDNILLKPGPLTNDEWVIMRQHPSYAYRLLSKIPYLAPALDIPYSHHEHWDGSGYPQGLAGEEIPLAARLFSIVDVWDALLSDRPYRQAWTHRAVIQYVKDQAGQLFDPGIVKVFASLIDNEYLLKVPAQ